MLGLRLNAGDPVARWVADDWSGGTANWVDRVGGKIATSYGSPVKATTQFGGSASSSGIVFDGVDDYFQVTAANNPIAGQKKVTIVALFKATQGATGTDGNHWNYPGPINAESGGSPNDFGLTIGTDGLAHAFFNGAISTPSSISVVDGLVHTMMLTWADPDVGDGTARFYVDGVLKGSLVTDGGSGIVADLIRFGRERETSTRWFRGTVGELRFYASIEDPAALHASMSNVVPTLGFASIDGSGGAVTLASDSVIHTFSQSGNFVPSTSGTVEVLVVGGGGGGGSGGGGAGGVVYQSSFSVTAGQSVVVTIGAGGTGGALNGTVLAGSDGGSSSFGSLVGFGGGGGGAFRGAGRSGASSGGTGGDTSAASGAATQGFRGANGAADDGYVAGGGGGGAGGVGTRGLWGADGYGYATASSPGGNGGSGVSHSISGTAKYYGGGGGGGANNNTGSPTASGGDGGLGGGGNGARSDRAQGVAGTPNTGGGGGGGDAEGPGGAGGSGVVIIRYTATTTQSARTLSVTGSATQTSFSAISGSVNGTDPDPATTLVYGIQGGAATATAGQVAKTGSYGTLTLNTATGAYSFAPSAAGINPLQASASEIYSITVTDGVATASVALTVQINVASPTQLALTTQPAGVINGTIMTTPLVIEIRDSQGNRTASTGAVTVSIDSGAGGALSGTLSVNAVNGIASFNNLTMTGTPNSSYRLRFSSGYQASSTGGQAEWAYVVRNGRGAGRSLLAIDMRQFTGSGIDPSRVSTIQLLDLYSGAASWIATDSSWAQFEISSALSNAASSSYTRLMFANQEYYGIRANFTFAPRFTSATSSAFTVQSPPTLAAIGVSGTEDIPLTFSSGNFSSSFVDPEGASLASIQIVDPPATGVLSLAGSAVTAAQVIPFSQLGSLTYTPAANESGAKTFTVKAFDGSAWSSVATVTMTLAPVNDAPVAGSAAFTPIAEDVAVADNAGTAVSVFANAGSDGDSGALKGIAITSVDSSNGSWQYTTDGGVNWSSLSGVSSASARLLKSDELHRVRFLANPNFNGTATIQYRAWDQVSGADAALVDLSSIDGGAWVLVAYGANASLGGFLNSASGTFSSVLRSGSAVLPALSLLKSSSELAMSWTLAGGGFPVGGIASYSHAIAFPLPQASAMSFDGTATSPPKYFESQYNAAISFAVGSTHPDQSLVTVRTLAGSPGMPEQMYVRNKSFGVGYGGVYGLVMNDGSNPQLDYGQFPDGQTFKAVYLDHGTGDGQQSGLVMGGAGGVQNSYVPSTMALWARLSAVQISALVGTSVSSSGQYLLADIGTTYLDLDSSASYSANSATGTVVVTPVNDAPVLTVSGTSSAVLNASTLKASTGATADGVYSLFFNGVSTPVYCLMNDALAGGGWMLAMKGANSGDAFNYSSAHWTTATTLNTAANRRNDAYNEDAKFEVFNSMPASEILVVFPEAGAGGAIPNQTYGFIWKESMPTPANTADYSGRPTQSDYTGKTLRELFAGGEEIFIRDAVSTTPYQAAGSGVFSTQTDVRFFGFNYVSTVGNNRVRFGFGWNENGGDLYPGANEQSNDVSGGLGLDRVNWSAGDYIGCCQNSTGLNRPLKFEVYVRGPVSSSMLTEDVEGNVLFESPLVQDVDSSSLTVTLSALDGVITGLAGDGVLVGGTATARTFAGLAANLNAYFATAGKVTYLGAANNSTDRTLTVSVSDGSAMATGSRLLSLIPVNDVPSLGAIAKSGSEDTAVTFAATDFSAVYSDPESSPLASITVLTLPSTGSLKLSGVVVTAGQVIASADLANLAYTPAANENGPKTFTVKASDGIDWSEAATVTMTLAPVNDAPYFTQSSITYDAFDDFVTGPTLQVAGNRWQYFGGSVSGLNLLANWKTGGNEVIPSIPQWDGSSGHLNNYPFVQRIQSAVGPVAAGTLVMHPSNLGASDRAVAVGWKNTSTETVAVGFKVSLRLPYGSANGIDYWLQRGLLGAPRYWVIRSGSLGGGSSATLGSDETVELQAGEMLYLIVDSKDNFEYDHTEVSNFEVTVNPTSGANGRLGTIAEDVANTDNLGTVVSAMTAGISDADSGALKGIAVSAVDSSNGNWQSTTDGGLTWLSLSEVSAFSARLLKGNEANHRIRFTPHANYNGPATITYHAWDQTSSAHGNVQSHSEGLLAWLGFENNLNDLAEGRTHGGSLSIQPDGFFAAAVPAGVGAGEYSGVFNGTSTRVDLANSASLNVNTGVPFSMAAWIRTSFNDSGQRVILAKALSGATPQNNTAALFVDSGGRLRFDNFWINAVSSSASIRTGEWVHVAVTYDGATYRLYVGGQPDGAAAFAGSNDSQGTWTFSIGQSMNTEFPGASFQGNIDEVGFWNRALGSSEVAALAIGGIGAGTTAFSSDPATATITVTPVNDIPVATAQTVTTDEDTAKAITLAGTDVEGSTLVYTVVTQPTKGVLSGTGANLTYTPKLNANGSDSFTFKVNDGTVDSGVATVSITITAVNDAPTLASGGSSAVGGTKTSAGGYTIHTFTADGTFTPTFSGTVEVLVVGGGGGGGSDNGGGGGGGGYVVGSSVSVSAATPITVKVGAGGQGAPNASSTAFNGGDSSFGTLTARGGGGGGSIDLTAGADGGSAGGRAANRWGGAENATVTTSLEQGFDGGGKNPGGFGGGGGGGAGGSGSNGGSNIGGNGGAGRSSDISGMVTHYAGGGGGGGDSNTAGTGGIGGGGNGSRRGDEVPTPGTDGLGGGGGAAGGSVAGGLGARGGSGTVVVRYSSAVLNGLTELKYVDGAATDTFTVGSGTLAGTDVDTGTTLTYGITGGILESGVVTKTGTYGTLRVTPATGAYSFTPNEAAINALSTSTSETFVVTVSDGIAMTAANLVINLTGVNDAPTVTAPASFALTEDVAGNLVYLGAPFADVDSASLTVTLSVTDGTITGSAVTGITVGGTATARTFAGTMAALNTYFTTAGNITYQGPLNNTTSRTLTTAVVDGTFEAYPVTSLQARYDASNSGSLTKAGTEVSQWADLSGNGFHLSAIENGRPSLGQVNELPAMNFNPGKGFSRTGVPLNTEVTVLMAIRYSSAIGNWGNFMHHGQHDDDWSMRKSDWSNPVGKIGFHTNNDNNRVMNSLVNDMTYVLVGRLRTSTGNSLVDYWAYPATGDEFSVLNADLGPKSITGGSKTLYVGTSDVGEASNGMIGEILYYNTALSDSALSVAADYLKNKWLGNAPTAIGGDLSVAVSTTSTIYLTPVNDAPVNTVPGVQVVAEDALLNFTDTSAVTVGDIDSTLLEVELSVLQGVLKVVLPAEGVTLSGGAIGSSVLKLSGEWTALNQTLATLNYQGTLNYFGPDTLTIRTTDDGGLSDTDTVGITVTPVNDPPVLGAVDPAIVRLVGVDWALPADLPRRVALPISDIDSAVDGSLAVSVSSGDSAAVPASAIRAVHQGGWFLEVAAVVPDADGTATVPVTVTVTDAAGGSTSRAVDVVIQAPPRIVSPLVGGEFPTGGTLQLTIEATGTAPFTYVWYHNSVRVEGADGPMLNVSPAGSERSGRYSVVVSNDLGQHESGLATVVMVDPPKFLTSPVSIWALEGSSAELKADAIGGEPLIYEWFREGQWVFTGKVWNRAWVNASDAGAYELRVRNSVATLRSGPVFVTVQRPRVEVQGWGDNSFRQLVFDPSWTNLVSVSAGERFTVGLRADGSVVVNGALGQPPVFGARVVGVAAGGEHAVALLENGTIRAWGTTTPAVTAAESRSGGVFQVVAGADYTAWLDADGRLQIAGGSASGITVPSESLIQYRSLAAGPTALLGRLRSTGVWSSVGGKGRGVPVVQGALVGLSQVALGLAHGLGISGGGANLVAWGDGGFEQTTIPTTSLPATMTAVSAGHYHSVVLGSANQVVAWGAGSSASATAWPHYAQSIVPENLKAAQVAAGGFHTVVLAHRAPEFSTGLAAQSVQLGQAASLTVMVDGVAPITYQWTKGGTAFANQTGATLTIASTTVADGGTYRVTATTPYGSIYSEAILTVIEPPTVTTTATTQTLNAGGTATFAVSPTGTGPFTYQWLLNDEPIDGATSETLALSGVVAAQAGVYKVQVSGLGGKVTSTVITVSVLSLPVFSVQPLSVAAISGQTASLKATATGGGTVTLQWQKQSGSDASVTWTAISGATSASLDFSNVQSSAAGTYRIVASNAAGSVNSAEVTLTVVNPAAPGTPEITVATVLSGTATPVSLPVVTAGVARTLSGVVATVYRLSAQYTGTEPVQLQWLRDGVDLVGATTSVLELPALDAGGKQDGLYQVRLMNAAGPGAAATGAGVRLTTAGAPRLLVAPLKEVLGQIGGTVSLPLEVAGTVSTVVWRKNGVVLSVATGSRWSVSGSSLTITGLLDEDVGRYEATLNNSLGSLVTPEIVVRLTGTPPGISTQPQSEVKLLGTSLSLSVTASGPVGVPLTYQWILDGKAIAGATSSSYGVTSIGLKDVGDYTVLVTARGNGSVSSVPATVRLVEAPVITQQPVDVNALVGTAVTLKVVAKGDAASTYPTTYRWYNRNGPIPLSPATGSLTVGGDGRANGPTPAAPVSGQATDTLVVTHTEVPPDGVVQYYCVVENAAGKVTSKPALVVVLKALSELAVSGDTNAIQTFNLKPGWNAIYLTVQPANSAIDTVFAGIPWSSVWRFKNKRDPVQFIQDMSEAQWDSAKWLVRWRDRLPSGETNPYAFDNTLTKVLRHQAYLVHISGTNAQTLRVLGGRGHLPTRWVTDNYNLTGYPVGSAPQVAAQVPEVNAQPDAPAGVPRPSDALLATLRVQDFLAWHSELWDGSQSAPRGMYRLTAEGIWVPMVAGDEVKYGEAYWVYAKGAPKTSGSFGLELDYGESLDFPDDNDRRTIKLVNPKSTSTKVRIQLQAAGTVSLSATIAAPNDPNFGDPNKATVTQPPTGQATSGSQGVNNVSPIDVVIPTVAGMVPINLALSGVVELAAGEERTLVLKANRSSVGATGWRNLLLLDDGISTYQVPASIKRSATLLTGKSVTKRRGASAKPKTTPTAPGLWLGRVSIGGVSPVNGYDTQRTIKNFVNDDGVATNVVEIAYVAKATMAEATPVSRPLEFNVLIHVDNTGVSKILQEVYLMQVPQSANGTPGSFVLISDRRNLANFQGTAMKGRERSGRRLSSMVLGLNGAARTNGYLAMSGQFKAGNAVTVTVGMDSQSPLNPFYHKYHPDHDNLTADFKVYQEEAYGFSRDITVALNADQDGAGSQDGSEVMKGTYTEVIRGLHRLPIQVTGQVEMVRVSTLGVINPTTW